MNAGKIASLPPVGSHRPCSCMSGLLASGIWLEPPSEMTPERSRFAIVRWPSESHDPDMRGARGGAVRVRLAPSACSAMPIAL
jgi:hypothetical protein